MAKTVDQLPQAAYEPIDTIRDLCHQILVIADGDLQKSAAAVVQLQFAIDELTP